MKNALLTGHWASRHAIALLLVLLVAAGLRLARLPELPLGLHYDEAANGVLASEIARGINAPVFISSYTGKEVLFFYWAALWMRLLGITPLALRLSAALMGLATVGATVWAVCELLHGQRDAKWVALLTGALLATSFWHLVLSRYGFRAVAQPLMQALTIAALWRGLRMTEDRGEKYRGWLVLAGVFCGLTAYTYLAARAFVIPLSAALLTFLVADQGRRRVRLGQLILFVAVAALTLAPLAHYWLTHPGSFLTRVQQVTATSWSEGWAGLRACLGMFLGRGDPYIRFNIPHRPLLDPITGVTFLLGLAAVAWELGRPVRDTSRSANAPHPTSLSAAASPHHLAARVFLITYLPIMLLPSALAVGDIIPSNLRTAGLLPFVYLFPALGLSMLGSMLSSPPSPLLRSLSVVLRPSSLVLLVLALITPATAVAYFRDWAPSAALYDAADGDLADVAAVLNQADLTTTTPYVASIHYRHPTLAFLAKEYGAIRWLTGGRTIVFPAEGDALLIFSRSASGELSWVKTVLPEDALVTESVPSSPDGAPAFHAYHISSTPGSPTRPGEHLTPTHPLSANLAHVVHLLGYDVVGEPRSGESAQVAVWWRVLNVPNAGDYGPVARLTDPWGFAWGQTQPFHYPSEQWTPGEWVIDLLPIPIAPGAPPGDYVVRFSLYSASADSPLPLLDETGRYAGTSVQLPVRLARAITSPRPEEMSIRNRLDARADSLILLGFNLDTTSVRPGERLILTLFWRSDGPSLPDTEVTLTLGSATVYTGAPVHDTYPTSAWTAGEIVADRYNPRLPRDMPPGDHLLQLLLDDPSTGSGQNLALDLGLVTVEAIDRTFDVPPISHPLTVTLGGQVQLLGYDFSAETIAPGDTLVLTLYWQALTEMETDYTVFTHVLAPNGSTTGQRDNHPVRGTYPTSLWLAREVVTDVYEIAVRTDAPPGTHRLEVGMYVAETGARLPSGTPNDAIGLQTITITGPQD